MGPTMSYKTILVHLNDERRVEAVLEPAMTLARRYNAHLIGMHVYAALPAAPISIPYASKVIAAAGAERKATQQIAAIFTRMTANQPFVPEWRALKVPHVDLASVVMDHGRAADLIVAGQTDPDWDLSPLMDFPERLALESGRPVLVVPSKAGFRNSVAGSRLPGNRAANPQEPCSTPCPCSALPKKYRSLSSAKENAAKDRSHRIPRLPPPLPVTA